MRLNWLKIVFENLEDGMAIDEVMEQFPGARRSTASSLERGVPVEHDCDRNRGRLLRKLVDQESSSIG